MKIDEDAYTLLVSLLVIASVLWVSGLVITGLKILAHAYGVNYE